MDKPNPQAFHDLVSMRMRGDGFIHLAQLRWINFSTAAGMYHTYQNEVEAVVGYIIWAYVNDETVVSLERFKRFPIYSYEWDEGSVALILDFYYSNHGYRPSRSLVLQAFPGDLDRVAFVKRDTLKMYRSINGRFRRVRLDQFVI